MQNVQHKKTTIKRLFKEYDMVLHGTFSGNMFVRLYESPSFKGSMFTFSVSRCPKCQTYQRRLTPRQNIFHTFSAGKSV